MDNNTNIKKIAFGIVILIIISFILYHQPVLSGKPLGLDALGHLSKVSYLKQFPHAKWDMVWYGGAPFLKFYSPLFYYLVSLFPNSIFGANFTVFLSLVLTSIGIFLLIYNYNKNFLASIIAGILFLTVLNTSYYYLVVGNHPFVLAFWTIPFALLFLEKSLKNKLFFIPYTLIFLISILSHIFITICIMPLVILKIIIHDLPNKKDFIKHIALFVILPVLLSSFWLLPFLTHSSNFVGDDLGYIPSIDHLLGFGNYIIWGKASGEIGFAFLAFLAAFFIFLWSDNLRKNKESIFFAIGCAMFFLLMCGLLSKYNPAGIGAVRYIVPLSILCCIFSGLVLGQVNLKSKKTISILIFALLVLGLWFNYKTITENYNQYSYNKEGSRYDFIQKVIKNERIPINNNFSNYRFGTTRFIFSETLNFFYPSQSQTFVYYDQAILYPDTLFLMRDSVWRSDNLNSTLFFLDWFGIKYFELGGEDLQYKTKLQDRSLFKEVDEMKIADYPFVLYEYKNASPIISLFKGRIISVKEKNFEEIKSLASANYNSKSLVQLIAQNKIDIQNNYSLKMYNVTREDPDKIEITFNEIDGENIILFKEFYHPSWKAKEFPSGRNLEIYKTALDSMAVLPAKGTNKVIFYQARTLTDLIGIALSLLSLILTLLYVLWSKS